MQILKETFQLYEARLNAWYEEGCEVAPFKSGLPSNSGAPSNSGLQCPPFQPLNNVVCRRFEPAPRTFFKQLPPIMAIFPF